MQYSTQQQLQIREILRIVETIVKEDLKIAVQTVSNIGDLDQSFNNYINFQPETLYIVQLPCKLSSSFTKIVKQVLLQYKPASTFILLLTSTDVEQV